VNHQQGQTLRLCKVGAIKGKQGYQVVNSEGWGKTEGANQLAVINKDSRLAYLASMHDNLIHYLP
jgi:hypothetical protein